MHRAIKEAKRIMNVLVCASECYPYTPQGGVGMCVHNTVLYLKKLGVKCDVCSPHGPDIKIPPGFIGNKHFGVLSLLWYWHRVSQHLKNYASNYDVVWLHQPFVLSKFPFKNCFVTMHTSIFDCNKLVQKNDYPVSRKFYYSIREKIEKWCIHSINHYTSCFSVVSPHVGSALEKVGISSKKIVCVSNGVDIHKFKPNANKKELRAFYGIPENAIVFTYVGRITAHKLPFTLIKFFSRLSQQLKNAWLIIAGDGELLDNMKQLVYNLGLKNVLFLGYVNNEELPFTYGCSDIYLMTSIYEGQPITLLEAMASGLPSVVSDIASLRLIVEESNSGLVLDFHNIEKSVTKTLQFLKDEDLKDLSKRARQFIENNHSWEKVTNKYVQIFNKIMST